MCIAQEQLVEAFSDCVGREKARTVIDEIAQEVGPDTNGTFTEEQALEISARIANQDDATPYIRTAANTLQTRIQTGQL